ncbi:sigma-54 interaction domain-containing protein [Natronincola ferrireducens]|uniref:Arginine utilization regulatory protein n=1 Tax=Natronincola ferrireducens TaxID=393762 RepID=A0A1G8Z3G1_9FIRM|nr:sigma 54-interacting transcriptional regulator [Natronincola ferrireducens]SDK09576.1 arginine utilization regulatory protein [Natronincola ferrireducens]
MLLSLLEEILNNVKEAIIVFDENYQVAYMNKKLNLLFETTTNTLEEVISFIQLKLDTENPNETQKIIYHNKILKFHRKSIIINNKNLIVVCIEDCTMVSNLEDSNYCFSTVLNSIHEGILIADTKGKIQFYNKQIQIFEGLEPCNILGKPITEVYNIKPENSEHRTVLKTQTSIIDRYQKYHTMHNKEIHLIASTYPIIKNGKIISTYSVSRNLITIKELLNNSKKIQKRFSPIYENMLMDKLENNTRYTLNNIIGKSSRMMDVIKRARKAGEVLSPLLIYGETGTGKELFVQGIHNENPITKNHPFLAINCAAIPESLLESLLFGTVEGSFTGSKNSIGLIEQAGHGTLYLDEINSMPLNLQAKILRVLQEKQYRRVGGKEELALNCRVVSSTNIPPFECLSNSTLRMDLYFRLAVISIEIPPLRERLEDVDLLTNYFIEFFSMKYGKPIVSASKDLIKLFCSYSWPGNVRELEHIIESVVTMIDYEETILPHHLPSHLTSLMELQEVHQKSLQVSSLAEALLDYEKEVLLNALEQCNWNISQTAKKLGIVRQNLQYRMRKLKIKNMKPHTL